MLPPNATARNRQIPGYTCVDGLLVALFRCWTASGQIDRAWTLPSVSAPLNGESVSAFLATPGATQRRVLED
jgi:hypothetical protein